LSEAKLGGFIKHRSTLRLMAKPRLCLRAARWGWSLYPARSKLQQPEESFRDSNLLSAVNVALAGKQQELVSHQ
jgi:hypothetical protein